MSESDIDPHELDALRNPSLGVDVSEFFGGNTLSDIFVTFSDHEIEQLKQQIDDER